MDFFPTLNVSIALKNCTVTPDEIKKEYGPVTAIVWGELFRFCQMYDSVCNASLDTIAKVSGLSKRAVITHLQILCENGYAIDETPSLRNKPHTYRITSKVKIEVEAMGPNYLGISGTFVTPEPEIQQTPEELWNG